MRKILSIIFCISFLFTGLCTSVSAESATSQLQEMYAQGELLMTQGDYAGAAAQFETLGPYSDASQMAMYCKGIMAAETLGMYDAAISAFESLGDFKDSKQLITYYQGRGYQATGDLLLESEKREDFVKAEDAYNKAMSVYSGLALFKDCLTRLSACQSGIDNALEKIIAYDYAAADRLEQAGKYIEAWHAFLLLGDYSDSMERADRVKKYVNRNLKNVGSYVLFGTYPQTESGTDTTPIEWLVLDVQGDKSLLISRYALDCQPYNTEDKAITWEKCTLRNWLNSEFLNKAFSADEQNAILTTQVDNSDFYGPKISGGNNTQDQIYLLSYAEECKYFADDAAGKCCAPTDYAAIKGGWVSSSVRVDGKVIGRWWLRSPGNAQNEAACVDTDGSCYREYFVYATQLLIRPVLWLNLDSEIFKSLFEQK